MDAFERYDPKISGSAWIYTIARTIINQAAKNRPQVDLEEIEDTDWDRQDWDAVMELRHDERRLLQAIDLLPCDEGNLIRMKYLEGWRYEEIAECLNRSAGFRKPAVCSKLKAILKYD